MPNSNFTLKFNAQHAKSAFQILVVIEICLVALYIMDYILLSFGKPHHTLNLDAELTLSSWFSSIQLFFIGVLILIQPLKIPPLKHISLPFLSLIGLGFMFLSLDETIMIHEKLSFRFIPIEWLPRFKNNHGLWIPIYVAIIVAFLIASRQKISDFWRFYRKESIIFSLGVFFFLLGGVVFEIISYEYLLVDALKKWYLLEVAIEEGLEMFGASMMLYAALLLALH